jgi:glucose-6-phosphate dehydrogenase assembly protein OpcA
MVGGGVRIGENGIDRVTITQVGVTIDNHPLFIMRSPDIGRMITGNVSGKEIIGTPSEEITVKFRKTGTTGKKIGIGRKSIIGASRKHDITRTKDDKFSKRIEEETIEMIETTSTTSATNTARTEGDDGTTGKTEAFIVVGLNYIILCHPANPLFYGA